MKKRLIALLLAVCWTCCAPLVTLAHSGRTDSNGGHHDRKNGGYHYHNSGSTQKTSKPKTRSQSATQASPKHKLTIGGTPEFLHAGKSVTLTCLVDQNQTAVSWSSSNQRVATVSKDGVVTGKSKGSATIKASYDGSSASWTVRIKSIPVTEITADRSLLLLETGESATLKISVTPSDATNRSLRWQSTQASIASVDGTGKIMAKKVGFTKVSASVQDEGRKSVSIEVFVVQQLTEDAFPLGKQSGKNAIAVIQTLLRAVGEYKGTVDGQWTTATRSALKQYCDRKELDQDAFGLRQYATLLAEARAICTQ